VAKLPKPFSRHRQPTDWREFQASLPQRAGTRRTRRRLLLRALAAALLLPAVLFGILSFLRSEDFLPPAAEALHSLSAPSIDLAGKADLRRQLDPRAFTNLTERCLTLPIAGRQLQVETTLDPDLQRYLLARIDRDNSRHVGIVVMEPTTGRVLAMAGYDRLDPAGNPCLHSSFPAASLFKIVSAAAAVDQCGYTAESQVHFRGGKHTLYKQQLTDKVDRYTTTLSLREAFADSVNPVFGKLGELRLGKVRLEESAADFGFNAPLDFDLPCPPSRFQAGDEPYAWAEAASGFNLDTTISPLHGAMIASATLNAGRMTKPSLVERIADEAGETLYRRQPAEEMRQAMTPRAAVALRQMMEETIDSGTGRKAFRRYRQDKVLSRLQIGGKTGSIDNATHEVRYDWFVGFARERQGGEEMVVAVVVGHEKYIGIRAAEYARMAMSRYFSSRGGDRKEILPSGAGATAQKVQKQPRPT